MTLKAYKTYFINELVAVVDATEADYFFFITLEKLMKLRKIDFATKEITLTEEQVRKWNGVLTRLKQHEPIQYIFEETFFYGLPFKVSPSTLIPRPETEELVEWILATLPREEKLTVLDIGSGSGCIPVTLAKLLPKSRISGMDISEAALQIAQFNANQHQVNIKWLHQDILLTETLNDYNVIVSNPPYVRLLEKKEILTNVLEYEPHLALFVPDNDPLLFYRKIVHLAAKHLKPSGYLFLEINQYLGKEMLELFHTTAFKKVELRKDLSGNDRMIKAQL